MIKFLPLDFLSVSRRVPWENKNAVYRLQISALVPEIFKFEKWVKYANEMTDDVIHSTQYYIKHINGAILANRPFPSSFVPLFQSESKCETILMKMSSTCSFIFMQIKLIFIRMVSYLDSLRNRGTRELGNGLFALQSFETWQADSSTGNTHGYKKIPFPWQLTLVQSPPIWFQYDSDFQLEKC